MKNTGLKGVVKCFSVDLNSIDTNNILDIDKYLMKRAWYKIMFGLTEKVFIGLLTILVSASNYTKCTSLSSQKFMTHSTYCY